MPVKGGILWLLIFGSLIILVITLGTLFVQAHIDITLEQKEYSINTQMVLATEPTEEQLLFKIGEVKNEQSIIVPSTQKQVVNTFAQGKVRIFSKEQKSITLPIGTMLVSSEGKKFTTISAVTITEMHKQLPSSVDVIIQAEQTGDTYNGLLDDFTLPQFPQLSARSLSETIGGNDGDQFVIDNTHLLEVETSLRSKINKEQSVQFLMNQIPEEYYIPESLVNVSDITFHTENVSEGVKVVASYTITGIMINRYDFQMFLKETLPETERAYMEVYDVSNIVFSLRNNVFSVDTKTLPVNISGVFIGRADFDKDKIPLSIVQKKKRDVQVFLSSIPGVVITNTTLTPSWVQVVPNKLSKISFQIKYQNK